MSDREIIIRSLKRAERRLRANRLLGDLTFGLSLFLLFPLAFKIWDLFSPFRGRTVAVVLVAWGTCLVLYSFWRILQKGTLEQTAAQVDRKAALYDELKTACWFIAHPLSSDWVDSQIRRASRRVSQLNIDLLYPRVVPASSYLAAGLLALFIGVNFVPLPWNHNWVYLQAAPAFSLTDAERNFLAQAEQLLEKTGQLRKTELAARIEKIMNDLQEGKIDVTEAIKRLKEIETLLRDEALDTDAVDKALDEMVKDFETSEQLKGAAQALQDKDLAGTATKLEKLSDDLETATAEQLKEMQEALKKASQSAQNDLKELSQALKSSADNLKDQDTEAAKRALEDAGEFLKDLAEKIQNQELTDQTVRNIQSLTQSLEQRNGNSQQAAESEPPPGEGDLSDDAGDPQTDSQDAAANGSENSTPPQAGPSRSGTPNNDAPVEGAPTQNLSVQLEQERLTGQYDQEVKPEELEQASKEERSKLEYRNIPSELSAAQKDVLNHERIPWEYRRLIQNYFAAIQRRLEVTRADASASPRGRSQ